MTSSARHGEGDVRGHSPPCLVVVNVECDLVLIRVQAARWEGMGVEVGGNFF